MADEAYMGTQVIANAEAGFCKIKTPDTGNPNSKNPAFRNKAPKWCAEIVIDRDRDAALLSQLKQHAKANGYDGTRGEEPWVKSKGEYTKDDKTYPAYEYIDVMTTKNPHEWNKAPGSRIVNDKKMPFTDEVFKGSKVTVVFNPHYTEVHKYYMTFYLDALQVLQSSGGGGADPMSLLSTPSFGDDSDADPMESLTTEPSFG